MRKSSIKLSREENELSRIKNIKTHNTSKIERNHKSQAIGQHKKNHNEDNILYKKKR